MAKSTARHLTDQELVAELDRERPAGAPHTVHLEGCWSCRARLDELESAMYGFIRLRDDVLLAAPEPPSIWPGLEAGMDRIDAEGSGLSLWSRIRRKAKASWSARVAVAASVTLVPGITGATPAAAVRAVSRAIRRFCAFGTRLSAGFRLRPSTVLTTLVTCAIAIWLWTVWDDPRLSASQVLNTARAADARTVLPGHASHRVLSVEERVLPRSDVVRRQRVEIWRDRAGGITARRLYNERSQIAAGEWARPDGTRTIYRAGERPKVEAAPQTRSALSSVDVWRREPTADDFIALAASLDEVTVTTRQDDYVLTYRPQSARENGLIEATLAVAKSNGRATAQTVLLREESQLREFTLMETGIEQVPYEKVAPHVFQPEPVLLGDVIEIPEPIVTPVPVPTHPSTATIKVPSLTPSQLDQIELDAAYRLFRSKIWLGQNGEVTRTAQGIQVRSSVAREDDKATLDRNFEGFIQHPAVTLDFAVSEPAEIASEPALDPALLQKMPVYAMLQEFFSWNKSEVRRDEAIRTVTDWVLTTIKKRAERLRALQTLITRWPEERLHDIELESVVTWQRMVQEHAQGIRQDTELLRVQLVPVFRAEAVPSTRDQSASSPIMTSVADAAEAAALLETFVVEQDEALRAAFEPCGTPPCAQMNLSRLMESFSAIESVAGRFADFHLRFSRVAR